LIDRSDLHDYDRGSGYASLSRTVEEIILAFDAVYKSTSKFEQTCSKYGMNASLSRSIDQFIMLERGRGLGFDAAIISLHEDYLSYLKVLEWLRGFDFLELEKTDSFLINLEDEVRYRPLTFSTLATCLLLKAEKHGAES
jgi:hypothetical protein